MKAHQKIKFKDITPEIALDFLKEGNQRFMQNLRSNRNLLEQVESTSFGQSPFAIVLSCIDSRVPAELVFDQGIGDIFSARVAGNIINDDLLASIEYAVKATGSKLVMVLGHTNCGAVKGACDHVDFGNLSKLLRKIEPAIEAEKTVTKDRTSNNDEFVNKVATINIRNSVEEILENSDIVKEASEKGDIKVVGAIYDVSSGEVSFDI